MKTDRKYLVVNWFLCEIISHIQPKLCACAAALYSATALLSFWSLSFFLSCVREVGAHFIVSYGMGNCEITSQECHKNYMHLLE